MRRLAIAVILAGGVWVGGCLDGPLPIDPPIVEPPVVPPAVAIWPGLVSDPVAPASAARLSGALALTSEVVYASLAPGTLPMAESAVIRNRRTGSTAEATLLEGGLDPVALEAGEGDTVDITVAWAGGDSTQAFMYMVRPASPPVVVRTEPPPRKVDVPLNATMLVVFSEPIEPTTLTETTVYLLDGQTSIAGTLAFADAARLTATFEPNAPLAPGTEYVLEVTQGIEDLDGDSLEVPVSVAFETLPPVNSVDLTPDALSIVIGGSAQLTVVARDSAGTVLTDRPVTWRSSDSAVAGVSPTGLVRGTQVGSALVVATVEGKVDTAAITVTSVPVAFVTVTPTQDSIQVGDTLQLVAEAYDNAGSPLPNRPFTWTSSDSAIADASLNGLVRGVAVGSVFIVVAAEGTADTAAITVTPVPVVSVTVSPTADTLVVGDSLQLAAVAWDGAGNVLPNRLVTWATGNSAIALVSPAGLVRGVAMGSTLVVATVEGKADTAGVTVVTTAVTGSIGLAFAVQPLHTGAGLAITPHVQVTALDSLGARDETFADLITITLGGGAAGALSGTTTVQANSGVATFGDLRIAAVGAGYTLVATASSARAAATSSAFDIVPVETAQGRIAFSVGDYGGGIYVVNADGSAVTRLIGGWAHSQPAWSPDGSKIAFVNFDATGTFPEIHVMNADGSGATNLTNGAAWEYRPAWSPDGRSIAFVSNRGGAWGIFVMNADGGGVTRLTTEESPIGDIYRGDGGPIWSPDGTRIAFQRFTDQAQGLYVMREDGSGVALLTNRTACSPWAAPAWSPDGTKIAIGCQDIMVIAADGSGGTSLTLPNSGAYGWASWSPGGTMIAFSRWVALCPGCGGFIELHVMNADGSDPRQLVRPQDIGFLNAYQAAWSPR